jgi:hypothetical protein
MNFAEQKWVLRALLLTLDDWIRNVAEPPASRYPTLGANQLVAREALEWPNTQVFAGPEYMPQVWRMHYGEQFNVARIITKEPPALGSPYAVLVPRVNADGNELGGIPIPEVAVPLGTHTGWNITSPQLRELGYLAGLVGAFVPFSKTRETRLQTMDARSSIEERYTSRQAYLDQVALSARDLVRQRFMLADDVPAVVRRAAMMWDELQR